MRISSKRFEELLEELAESLIAQNEKLVAEINNIAFIRLKHEIERNRYNLEYYQDEVNSTFYYNKKSEKKPIGFLEV